MKFLQIINLIFALISLASAVYVEGRIVIQDSAEGNFILHLVALVLLILLSATCIGILIASLLKT